MKKMPVVKIILDIVMIFVLMLLYRKNAVSLKFHEVAGLILLGMFVIHLLLNKNWIAKVTQRLFSSNIDKRTKIGYLVDFLLLLSFSAIGISGVLISKTLFHFSGGNAWKKTHFFCAAVALILIGIHVGLHKQFFASMLGRAAFLPKKVAKLLSVILSLILIAYGCFALSSTSFTRWLSMPFVTVQYSGNAPGGGLESGGGQQQKPATDAEGAEGGMANQGGNHYNATSANPLTVLKTIVDFFSIAFIFAFITAAIDGFFRRKLQKEH
ncbi:MAG: DUF4405 domain-containing protein [Clostridia bacterium]|nr:DUF4405 domain-containing protein [Clostridia bacterium]